MADVVLRVANISKRFGGLQALTNVGITIKTMFIVPPLSGTSATVIKVLK